MSKLNATDISELFSTAITEFNTKIETIKNTDFDNSSFIDAKMKEISLAKKSIEEKNNSKSIVQDREGQILRAELDKQLSASNEIIYHANTNYDRNLKSYKDKSQLEETNHKNVVLEIENQKSEELAKINLRFEESLADLTKQKEAINVDYNSQHDSQLVAFDKIKQSSNEEIKNLHKRYFEELTDLDNQLNSLVNKTESKRHEGDKIKNDIAKLEREFEKVKSNYNSKTANASKNDLGKLKKEFAVKNKQYNSNRSTLSEQLSSFYNKLDKEISELKKNFTDKKNALSNKLLLDLVEHDYSLRNSEHLLALDNNKLLINKEVQLKKIDEQINLESSINKLNLNNVECELNNKILSLSKDYEVNLAKIEEEIKKLDLEYNRLKIEQNCLRNVCKTKLEFNLSISKVKNNFALKNAEVDEIKSIQQSKSEISISNVNLDYNRIKENYFITDAFFNITERAVILQNTKKSVNFASYNKVEAILKSKVSSLHAYIDELIEYNKSEYLNLTNALKDTHDLERKQLETVLSLVKKSANNSIIEYTTNNINVLGNLYREQLEAITNNYLAIEKQYIQYKNELSEGIERELAQFNVLASNLNSSLLELNNQIHIGVVNQTNIYNSYLNDFDKNLNNNINDITLMNTQELNKYSSSVEENNLLLNNQIADLQAKSEQAVNQLEQEKNNLVADIDKKLKLSDEELQARIKALIKSIDLKISTNQQQIDSNKATEQKLRLTYSKNIKSLDDSFNSNLKAATNEYNSNLEKSLKLKSKTIKVKKQNCQVGKQEDIWWRINEN